MVRILEDGKTSLDESVYKATFSSNNDYMAVTDQDSLSIYSADFEKRKFEKILKKSNLKHKINSLSFNPKNNNLAIGHGHFVTIYKFNGQKLKRIFQKKHPEKVISMGFDQNGKYLATGCDDWAIRIYKMQKKLKRIQKINQVWFPRDIVFDLDNEYLMTATGQSVYIYKISNDLKKFKQKIHLKEFFTRIDFSPNKKEILIVETYERMDFYRMHILEFDKTFNKLNYKASKTVKHALSATKFYDSGDKILTIDQNGDINFLKLERC